MSAGWLVVLLVGAATMGIKALGPALLGGRELPGAVMSVVRLLAPAVLAALVVVSVLGGDRAIVFDERLVGLGAGVVALLLRAPIVLVVLAAAAGAAVARALLG